MRDLARFAPALVLATSSALMLGALAFQYFGGLFPCPLCILQRYPHVITIVLGALALGCVISGRNKLVPWLLALAGLSLLAGAGIAVFHVGVEQGWWPGLTSCAGPGAGASLAETLNQAKAGPAARCDEVPWSLFGISMAGYNALISMAAGLLALWAAARQLRTAR
ncbi:MAG: disulfide bond formation protein B [Alphaproteobacteria bacterium]